MRKLIFCLIAAGYLLLSMSFIFHTHKSDDNKLLQVIQGCGNSSALRQFGIPGRTNSPGEGTCSNSGCHDGNSLNAGPGSVTINWSGPSNWQYVPGNIYTINITVAEQGKPLFGFDVEALDSAGADAGVLTISNPVETQIKPFMVSPNSRTNVIHVFNGGLTNNSHTFSFSWTAPASGNVTFYAAGVAADYDQSSSGDNVYTTTKTISPSVTGIHELPENKSDFSVILNPDNRTLSAKYFLDENYSDVQLQVYSVSGVLQKNIFYRNQQKGNYNEIINLPSAISSGIYIIKLSAPDKILGECKIVLY